MRRDGVTPVSGDLEAAGGLVAALRGCRYVVHTAAVYSFSPRTRERTRCVNVLGTRSLLEAARIGGVERAVVTSSSATLGPARAGRVSDERDWATGHHRSSHYHESKVAQERAALAAAMPVITVLPTAPIGPRDRRPTPTGAMVLGVIRGRIRGYLAGGMNVVDVRDTAAAHVLALERGTPRERYVIGGVNLSLATLFGMIADAAGRRRPRLPVPYAAALVAAGANELVARVTGAEPSIPLDGVRMGRANMFVSSAKAQSVLGYHPSPVEPAIEDAVRWFHDHATSR